MVKHQISEKTDLESLLWYRVLRVTYWLLLALTFFGIMLDTGIFIDAASATIINALLLYLIGKVIVYVAVGKKNETKIRNTKQSNLKALFISTGIVFLFSYLGYLYLPTDSYTYDYVDGKNCIVIDVPVTSAQLSSDLRYIDAEAEDLKAAKKDGEISNLDYEKKVDKLRGEAPKVFIWTDAYITIYQEDQNRYNLLVAGLPDPGKNTAIGTQAAFLPLSEFPEFNNSTFKSGDEIKVLVTNLNSSSTEFGWFYYSVVRIEHNGEALTADSYCQ